MRLNSVLITVLVIVSASLLYFVNYLSTFSRLIAVDIKPHVSRDYGRNLSNEISVDSLFLYRAYVYSSATSTLIRVFSINQCVKSDWKLEGVVNNNEVRFRARPIEGSCPWRWAPGCEYNSYVLDASSKISFDNISHITLFKDGKMLALPLQRIPTRTKGTLNVCVPPIYWFTDWIRIIFFLETWRAQGANHVFLYYHSSTNNVRKVLDNYGKQGFVTIIPWPSLPKNSIVDPNKSVYRLAHSLAHNDCILRIGSEFGALVDIDELIIPRNGSLLSFVTERFGAEPSVGALSFTHQSLRLIPSLSSVNFTFESLDFAGIFNATEFSLYGPPKVIFRTEAVDLQSTHDVREFKTGYRALKVPLTEAVLLHSRYNHLGGKKQTRVRLIPVDTSTKNLQRAMVDRANKIFPHGASFQHKTQNVLGKCLKPWRKTQNKCKTPISSCMKNLINLEDWHFVETSDNFLPL